MIQIENVTFTYNNSEEKGNLKNINLSIHQGEVVLLCGESGCGKTTLTRLINGLIPWYYEGELTGSVKVDGKEIKEQPLHTLSWQIGSVFQNPRSQFFNVDTTSEIAFSCENQGLPEEEIQRRIEHTVSQFHIDNLMDRNIFHLSGGEKQKIACASVSAGEPQIYVLDEPSSNLDVTAIDDLRDIISCWKAAGKTVIIAEHRLYYLMELADRIVYMQHGRICCEWTPAEFLKMSQAEVENFGLRPASLRQICEIHTNSICGSGFYKLNRLDFAYKGAKQSLNIPDLSLPCGTAVAVIGKNGAGKSTFLRCLCGLEKKCSGEVDAEGKTYPLHKWAKNCYLVMQDVNHQLFTESVLDEVILGTNGAGMEETENILDQLDLLPFKERHPMSLSGGQKQRVAIAGAIFSGKKMLLFDEPTSGLDFRHMEQVAELMQQLKKQGKTLLVVTHDPEFILKTCDNIIRVDSGRVTEQYPLDGVGIVKLLDFFELR